MPAITKKEELTEEFLATLKRKDLLNLCKEHGIKCVGKNSELIEKLLEAHQCKQAETPHSANFEIPVMPVTPRKAIDAHLPIVGTPNTSALIKSIVQSAKKTGLNSSPVRVPFALSPMAIKLHESKLNFSPMKAKEPSQVIKEAFQDQIENEEEMISLPFDNKRPREEMECSQINEFEDVANESYNEDEGLHVDKREKLENEYENEHENEYENDEKQVDIYFELHENIGDLRENIGELRENIVDLKVDNISHDNDEDIDKYLNNSYEMALNTAASTSHSLSSMESLDPIQPDTIFPPTNFSTDLLQNLKDPEFNSPELSSTVDNRVSRSEGQDRDDHRLDEEFSVGRSKIPSLSKSSSSGSSTKSNPLLPSGIVKLLEKKRQEKEQQQQQQNPTSSNKEQGKKKFDLKESLKRPLNYKPHTGSMSKKDF